MLEDESRAFDISLLRQLLMKEIALHTAAPTTVAGSQGYAPSHTVDATGQVAPPGMKPKVTATLWEDEGSLCFQVEAKGVCVARREGMFHRPKA